jgi:hypothetical protein
MYYLQQISRPVHSTALPQTRKASHDSTRFLNIARQEASTIIETFAQLS